jgi:hypothetical protein
MAPITIHPGNGGTTGTLQSALLLDYGSGVAEYPPGPLVIAGESSQSQLARLISGSQVGLACLLLLLFHWSVNRECSAISEYLRPVLGSCVLFPGNWMMGPGRDMAWHEWMAWRRLLGGIDCFPVVLHPSLHPAAWLGGRQGQGMQSRGLLVSPRLHISCSFPGSF